jgi:hypothetical protein
VGILEGKRPLGRCRHRCEDNIKIDIQELRGEGVDWKYCSGDQISKNEMGGTYSTYGGRGEVYTGFWWGY